MQKSSINELRAYFKGLKTSEQREFILKLREKTEGSGSVKYGKFLAECTEAYNKEAREAKKKHGESKRGDGARFLDAVKSATDTAMPDASTALFAKAIATMFAKPEGATAPPRLVGTWEREEGGEVYFFRFNQDGSFETDDAEGHFLLRGFYGVGEAGDIVIEPLEVLQINSLTMTPSGQNLCIIHSDGRMREYRRKQ